MEKKLTSPTISNTSVVIMLLNNMNGPGEFICMNEILLRRIISNTISCNFFPVLAVSELKPSNLVAESGWDPLILGSVVRCFSH